MAAWPSGLESSASNRKAPGSIPSESMGFESRSWMCFVSRLRLVTQVHHSLRWNVVNETAGSH